MTKNMRTNVTLPSLFLTLCKSSSTVNVVVSSRPSAIAYGSRRETTTLTVDTTYRVRLNNSPTEFYKTSLTELYKAINKYKFRYSF